MYFAPSRLANRGSLAPGPHLSRPGRCLIARRLKTDSGIVDSLLCAYGEIGRRGTTLAAAEHPARSQLGPAIHSPSGGWGGAMETPSKPRGFTLIEVMIVVAIMGVLAAIAIPTFLKYIKRTRTTEAVENLHLLFESSVSYFDAAHTNAVGAILPATFPESQAPTPDLTAIGVNKHEPVAAEWQTPTWNSLNFAISDPHYFAYQYDSAGSNIGATFTASAFGDLDGDHIYSTFVRLGTVRPGHEIRGSNGLYFANEIE
jgi:type IV pilus assembly protein PilA